MMCAEDSMLCALKVGEYKMSKQALRWVMYVVDGLGCVTLSTIRKGVEHVLSDTPG